MTGDILLYIILNRRRAFLRSTKSLVLSVAKVMSYKELEEPRAKRAAKETVVTSKVQRRCKRKGVLDSDAAESTTKVSRTGKSLEPWKALVARMVARDWG
ncbi:uncharacterized protein BDR25DRAFT_5702 [Lindgomyces ingoldianus]|uniref:Uncharacterized protein n=1 Tax=Lindgomyces ingoldianus TaxID=673940 RepID=A0ACB6RF85_9PLEO|nr:uncharacterized protein BDR25DRAFT_5702 [Lindgomyces ingoldianus]KAF2477939.1 hypothetical protein BDR25DRAFT_5702 [Lindgomyces ingoldianus]